jgi:sugar phosphate isomerase/epimerase
MIGIDSYSFHLAFGKHGECNRKKPMQLDEFFQTCEKLHADVVQLDPYHIPALKGPPFKELVELVKSYELPVVLGSVESIANDGKAAKVALEKYQEYLSACSQIGAKILRGVCGANRFDRKVPLAKQVEQVTKNGLTLAKMADDSGVTVAFENHGDLQARELASIIDGIDSDRVRVNFDNGNPFLSFEDPLEAARVLGPKTVCVHLKDYARTQNTFGMIVEGCALGEGVVPVAAQLAVLKQECPSAPLCLELPLRQGDEFKAVTKSMDWLKHNAQ